MNWSPKNLQSHYQKRIAKDRGCFEDILGFLGRQMTEYEYEQQSYNVVNNAWAEYECEARNTEQHNYYPLRAYYVDCHLFVSMTDFDRQTMRNCYHEHFDKPHGVDPGRSTTEGARKLRYKEHLQDDIRGGAVRNLSWIKDV